MLLIICAVLNLVYQGNFQYQIKSWAKSCLLALLFSYVLNSYIYTIQKGFFWFIFEVLAVSLNDVMAYFFGVFFGRTPLIKLSPKKTWEGFYGGLFGTFMVSFFFSRYLSNLMFMTCPVEKFSISLFQQYECEIHPVYLPH